MAISAGRLTVRGYCAIVEIDTMRSSRNIPGGYEMSFLNEFEQTLAERCHQNEPPFCQAVCPFRLDIKDLEDKWKKGRSLPNFTGSFKKSHFPS